MCDVAKDDSREQKERIIIEHGDIPGCGNAIAEHAVQKIKDAVKCYNRHEYVMAIVEMSYAIEESSKLYDLSHKFMNNEGITTSKLKKMYSHSRKAKKHMEEIFPSPKKEHKLSSIHLKRNEALIGFVTFREHASYVEFRYGHLLSIQNMFPNKEFLRQFTYYAIHWAIGIVCRSLMKSKISKVHHICVFLPFCIPEKAFSAPGHLIDVFSKIASIKNDRMAEQKINEHLESLKKLTVEEYAKKLKEHNNECYNFKGKKDDIWTKLANSNNPNMRKSMQRALTDAQEQKINVSIMKTGHSCSENIGYCENCDAYISSEDDGELELLALCKFISDDDIWAPEQLAD